MEAVPGELNSDLFKAEVQEEISEKLYGHLQVNM